MRANQTSFFDTSDHLAQRHAGIAPKCHAGKDLHFENGNLARAKERSLMHIQISMSSVFMTDSSIPRQKGSTQ